MGDATTADHKVPNKENESRLQRRYAVAGAGPLFWLDPKLPNENKSSQEPMKTLQKFMPPDQKPDNIHTDNSLEFIHAGEGLCWNHDQSTPYRSETNGISENAVRTLLAQSGFLEKVLKRWNASAVNKTYKQD